MSARLPNGTSTHEGSELVSQGRGARAQFRRAGITSEQGGQAFAYIRLSEQFDGDVGESESCVSGLMADTMPMDRDVRYYGYARRELESARCRRLEFAVNYFGPADQVRDCWIAARDALCDGPDGVLQNYPLALQEGLRACIYSGSELFESQARREVLWEWSRACSSYSETFGSRDSMLVWLAFHAGLYD